MHAALGRDLHFRDDSVTLGVTKETASGGAVGGRPPGWRVPRTTAMVLQPARNDGHVFLETPTEMTVRFGQGWGWGRPRFGQGGSGMQRCGEGG